MSLRRVDLSLKALKTTTYPNFWYIRDNSTDEDVDEEDEKDAKDEKDAEDEEDEEDDSGDDNDAVAHLAVVDGISPKIVRFIYAF
jgi:hypothetical protein